MRSPITVGIGGHGAAARTQLVDRHAVEVDGAVRVVLRDLEVRRRTRAAPIRPGQVPPTRHGKGASVRGAGGAKRGSGSAPPGRSGRGGPGPAGSRPPRRSGTRTATTPIS